MIITAIKTATPRVVGNKTRNLILPANLAIICSLFEFLLARGIKTQPSVVPPPLTSKAQSSVPLFNPRGVQLEKEDALVLQGKCFFTRFPERYPFSILLVLLGTV